MKEEWWPGQERFGMRPGLERISALLDRLDHPEAHYPIVHVAGTNGKGSVAAMVSEALISQGYRVGLNTSPDLGQINERIRINGEPLARNWWDRLGQEVEAAGRAFSDVPTFFEAVTALAFLAFSRFKVDIAVVEVGLGGRLDATNIIPSPLLSIITPIAYDHMDRLGNTIEAIAREKAGIIKRGTELVLANQPFADAREVIHKVAESFDVPVFEPTWEASMTADGPLLIREDGGTVGVPLLGAYQVDNLKTAWTAVERLRRKGWISRVDGVVRAWRKVRWPGRFQVVGQNPLIVVDGAHNPHGILGVVQTLQAPPWRQYRWHLLYGVLKDKPGRDMLDLLLPSVERVVLTRVPGERGSDPALLADLVPPIYEPIIVEPLTDAVYAARQRLAVPQDALLIVGSLSLLMHLNRQGLFQCV